jgi:alkylresorcinol/alkylpyrone synthase
LPYIIDTSVIDFEHGIKQSIAKNFTLEMFSEQIQRFPKLRNVFDNTQIEKRNLCIPYDFFLSGHTFKEINDIYQNTALEAGKKSLLELLSKTETGKKDITDMIYVNSTGLATPSIDALIINDLGMNFNINRYPVWGLGCVGGVSGISKANTIAKANPDALVVLINAELCSITFRKNDFSMSNFIATSLFSDGVSCALVAGDAAYKKLSRKPKYEVKITDTLARLYHSSLNVMGWEFLDDGFKVIFSKDIPKIISTKVRGDLFDFLNKNNLRISDIKNFIAHPGGAKIIDAYRDAFGIKEESLMNARLSLKNYGNMSSASVIYVLNEFFRTGFGRGTGLMLAVGPGFSSEVVLLDIVKI